MREESGLPPSTDDPVMDFREGIARLIRRDEPPGPVEMQAEVERLLAAHPAPARDSNITAAEQAQALADLAWDAGDDGAVMAIEALRLDANCVDAFVYLGYDAGNETQLAVVFFTLGMMAGADALGTEFVDRHAGEFYKIPETRPFLRAMEGVGHAALTMGAVDAATEYFEEMLRLDAEDHMDVRYALLAIALVSDNREMADGLFEAYEGDSPVWRYGHALHAFRVHGDRPVARRWLREALDQNPHVPAYVLGERPARDEILDEPEPGSNEEAMMCAADVMPLWHLTTDALGWLRAGTEAMRAGRRHWFAGLE